MMKVRFVGTGDAFGSGGRHHTSIEVSAEGVGMLVDLGASAFHALKCAGGDLGRIDTILITHFHGDHFGGLPFFLLDAQYRSRRSTPITIAGPPGVAAACRVLIEACYPGYSDNDRAFAIRYVEIAPGATVVLGAAAVTAFAVEHDPALAHCFGYRIAAGGKVFAYSGDTTWTEALVPLGRDADLFAVECYVRNRKMKVHMDYATLKARLPDVAARRVILTHMSDDILDNPGEIEHPMAEDGLTIVL